MGRLRAALTTHLAAILIVLLVVGALLLGSFTEDGGSELERRAAQVLSQVQGAGKVSVVISMRTAAGQTSMGLRGNGKETVPSGAVAVAQGADDPFICAQLTQALCALLGLPASSVSVISGG